MKIPRQFYENRSASIKFHRYFFEATYPEIQIFHALFSIIFRQNIPAPEFGITV